ncbi:MAG: DNA cytosine methyltransferase [Lentisphaeraceae bacterium]|nr:DNA cytosine methyltransferase [Lentisphaeraceae bacterium]
MGLGLHNAGWKGLFAVEKSPDAFLTLEHNLINKVQHFSWPNWLPKTALDINDLLNQYSSQLNALKGSIDLVAGGPPCQGFSTAGRRNYKDERNSLIDSYIEFIKLVEPKIIFFENVRGFTKAFKGDHTQKVYSHYIVEKLTELGYDVEGELLNFKNFGVPQSRTRFILVAVKKSELSNSSAAKSFFEKLPYFSKSFLRKNRLKQKPTLEDAIGDLCTSYGKVESADTKGFENGLYGPKKGSYQRRMRKGLDVENHVVDSHRLVKHKQKTVDRFSYAIEHKLTAAAYRTHFKLKKCSTKLLDPETVTPTLTTLPDDYIHYCEPRILTVREYARIQSFPDSYEMKGKYTTGGPMRVKEVPRYSQIGNAIPPLFGEQAGETLKELLNGV